MKTVRIDDGLSGFRQMEFVIAYNINLRPQRSASLNTKELHNYAENLHNSHI